MKDSLDRIRESDLSGVKFARLFKNMANAVETLGKPGLGITLEFVDDPKPGDLVPKIHLTLERVPNDTPTD